MHRDPFYTVPLAAAASDNITGSLGLGVQMMLNK